MSVVTGGGRSPALALWVDPDVHAAEIARFRSKIVEGPRDEDCSIWIGALGADGYGRYFLTRNGIGFCVRPNRYALALQSSQILTADMLALHECDIPVCVKVNRAECLRQHVVAGNQQENMRRMAKARRGGGRRMIRGVGRDARRARSVALREAVRHGGWDSEAVYEALSGGDPKLF